MIFPFFGSKIFTASISKWTKDADDHLLRLVDKWGPSWTLLSFKFPSRTPVEVRRRYLHLTGAFQSPDTKNSVPSDIEARLRAGWDRTAEGDWIRVPLDSIEPSPYAQLAKDVRRYRRAYLKKERNWQDVEEQRAVFFGALECRGKWERVVSGLKRRTAVQCKNFVEERLAAITVPAPDPQIEKIRRRLFSAYFPKNLIMHKCE